MLLATLGRHVPPLSPLTHEVLISLRSNDYFVGTPMDDEAKGERQRYSKGIARVYNLEAVS